MSAFDRLLAGSTGSAAPSGSSQTSTELSSSFSPLNKAEQRFVELSRRRKNALSDAKGTARWWKFLEVLRKTDPVSEETIAVQLRCLLCQTELSASNESRIATSHLRNAGCCKVKASPDLAVAVLAAFGKAADNAAPETTPDATDEEALQQLGKKRKANQPLIKDVYLSKEKQEDLTMALYDFFLECSDCVAMHVCEHPSLKKFCSKAGLPPLNRKRLAGPLLDSRYAETVKQVDDRLAKQSIGVQMATDGWKRKNVNEAQKILNFIANFPDGGTQFLTAYNTEGVRMDNIEHERIFTQQIISLGERLGSIEKVLDCITDREAAVQLAFASLEKKYHWMVNLVCTDC